MSKQRKKQELTDKETILVNGYYMPKAIVPGYLALRDHCVEAIKQIWQQSYEGVEVRYAEDEAALYAHDPQKACSVKLLLSPKAISQLEKVLGGDRFKETLKSLEECDSHGKS